MKMTNRSMNMPQKIICLQLIIGIYALSTVFAKMAATQEAFSPQFILWYGLEIAILGIYAILWQQILKVFPITVAYANKSIGLLWSLLFAKLFFEEIITIQNVIGVVIVIIGTMIVNSEYE